MDKRIHKLAIKSGSGEPLRILPEIAWLKGVSYSFVGDITSMAKCTELDIASFEVDYFGDICLELVRQDDDGELHINKLGFNFFQTQLDKLAVYVDDYRYEICRGLNYKSRHAKEANLILVQEAPDNSVVSICVYRYDRSTNVLLDAFWLSSI
ncbi:hypothetical protein J6X15_03540 [Candidatus Saccharibacteria bacterium]|nr:hypothetical protein [Candidatus Saccharibacteria bacterium]MBP5656630.1 hypothetical protein [Candidatus Saccharibacteria bacterium]